MAVQEADCAAIVGGMQGTAMQDNPERTGSSTAPRAHVPSAVYTIVDRVTEGPSAFTLRATNSCSHCVLRRETRRMKFPSNRQGADHADFNCAAASLFAREKAGGKLNSLQGQAGALPTIRRRPVGPRSRGREMAMIAQSHRCIVDGSENWNPIQCQRRAWSRAIPPYKMTFASK